MLITFSSKAYENIVMFEDVAKKLLQVMGHSGTVPGALKADEIPEALSKLESGVGRKGSADNTEDEQGEPDVSLAQRAYPLINMLKAASKNQANVMWK